MNEFNREVQAMRTILDTLEALSLPAAKRVMVYVIEHTNERVQANAKAEEAAKNKPASAAPDKRSERQRR